MDNCWISCQVMADIKEVYDDLIIINLYIPIQKEKQSTFSKETKDKVNFSKSYWLQKGELFWFGVKKQKDDRVETWVMLIFLA